MNDDLPELGSVVVDEIPWPVTGVVLEQGAFWIGYRVTGPLPRPNPTDTAQIVVNGPDGIEVLRGRVGIGSYEPVPPLTQALRTVRFVPTASGDGGAW